jgi:hypothetical protein
VTLLALLWTLGAQAQQADAAPQEAPPVSASSADPEPWREGRGRIQVRRENVDRGTSEETTKTYVRGDTFVGSGMLSIQVAFPDAQTDFDGSPFDPRLGDSKLRYRFAAFPAGGFGMSTFLETTFPTAARDDLGTGKYQISAGLTATTPFPAPGNMASHYVRFTAQLQQVNSVAGDENRQDINYTKLDLSLRDVIGVHWLKAALNTRADWELNGKTGAVAELEYGRRLTDEWSVWVLAGGRLWGEGVRATYGSKLMIGVDRWF